MKLLESNVHVITEKLTLRVDHYDHLVAESTKRNLHYGVVFQNRFNPSVKYIKSLLDDSSIGRQQIADISLLWSRLQSYYEDGWHGTCQSDGGVICQQAIHHIDAAVYLLGPIESVLSHATCLAHQLEAEDTHIALLRFKSGVLATLKATTALGPSDQVASLSVCGSDGFVQIDGIALNSVSTVMISNHLLSPTTCSEHSTNVPNGYGLSHIDFISKAINNILKGIYTPLVPVDDVRNVLGVIHALYEFLRQGFAL